MRSLFAELMRCTLALQSDAAISKDTVCADKLLECDSPCRDGPCPPPSPPPPESTCGSTCPSMSQLDPRQPLCSVTVTSSSVQKGADCLSVVELEVETSVAAEGVAVHYAVLAANQELYQNTTAASLRRIAASAADYAQERCGAPMAAGTWKVAGSSRPRVARVSGEISGAPIHFGCIQARNCSGEAGAGSSLQLDWPPGCSAGLEPDVPYTLALVCEVELCPDCGLGPTQLGHSSEQIITLVRTHTTPPLECLLTCPGNPPLHARN